MNEKKKTILIAGAAVVCALLALVSAPRRITPNAFLDQGEPFFPDFTDPNTATTLEVIEFDEETGSAHPFKVAFTGGKWVIPSHHDYPADGKDRLARTAAGVIGIKKDDFRSDNIADHEACGVIDPLDETSAALAGHGKRVTLKDKNEKVLADFIIGKPVENRTGFRFVRVPGQKRVYAVRMNIDISTKFADWIESDLLQVTKSAIDQITVKDYSINEQTQRIVENDLLVLNKKDDAWTANRVKAGQEVDNAKMNDLLTALDELKIVGVREKPAGLTQSLTQSGEGVEMTQNAALSLQSKGYFFTRDGSLRSNEGELQARTQDGVVYTLRFGEVVYGRGEAVSAGTESAEETGGPGENRYLFITTEFNSRIFPEPPEPSNTDFTGKPDSLLTDADRNNKDLQKKHDEWQKKIEKGQKLSDKLNARFAHWYYVISSASFEKLHLLRKDLIKNREPEKK